jgi:hypothetical protein
MHYIMAGGFYLRIVPFYLILSGKNLYVIFGTLEGG